MTSGTDSQSAGLIEDQVEALLKKGRDLAKTDKPEKAIALLERALVLELSKLYYLYDRLKSLIQDKSIYQAREISITLQNFSFSRKSLFVYSLVDCLNIFNWKNLYVKNIFNMLFLSPVTKGFLSAIIKDIRNREEYIYPLQIFINLFLDLDEVNRSILRDYLKNVSQAWKSDRGKVFEIYELWVKKESDNPEILADYAKVLATVDECQKSIALFECALQINNNNFYTLKSYANILFKCNQYEKSFQILEECFARKSNDIGVLNSYYKFSFTLGNPDQAFNLFERAIKENPNDDRILGYYIDKLRNLAVELKEQNYPDKALELFKRILSLNPNIKGILESSIILLQEQQKYYQIEDLLQTVLSIDFKDVSSIKREAYSQSRRREFYVASFLYEKVLHLDEDNLDTLVKYADTLYKSKKYDKAVEIYQRILKIKPNDIPALTCLGNILAKKSNFAEAIDFYERALKLDSNDVKTLTSYANLLVKIKEYKQANQFYKTAIEIEPNNVITLNGYANALIEQEKYETAFNLFKRSLEVNQNNVFTLNNYGIALAQMGKYDDAFSLFERALDLDKNNSYTRYAYGNALIKAGRFEQLTELQPNHSYARLQYAKQLEGKGKYKEALNQLLAINLTTQSEYHANYICLNLGRLYYQLNQPTIGKEYFDKVIANSDDGDMRDKSVLHAARSLLAVNPHSEEAVELLGQIKESSQHHEEAMKAIALNADSETSYELFGGTEEKFSDTEMLYRAMYHQIGNEVAILKSIAYRLLRKIKDKHPLVSEIVGDLEELQESIARQRALEKAEIDKIPRDNYRELINIISQTAHDISDEVNNILATLKSKTRRAKRKLAKDSPVQKNFEKLLRQIEFAETALNDLKSINEGIIIRRHRFPVRKLFEKWEPENWSSRPRIQKARIRLNIENADSEFDGDEEKIKSIINELIENSLKHNSGHIDPSIWIYSQDLNNPTDIGMPTIPGDRKYLYIQLADNGKGIPKEKKEWIFQPLNTTSPEEKGGGLGLFIARKTLQKMGGYIREVGEVGKGVKFQIYIPYVPSNEVL